MSFLQHFLTSSKIPKSRMVEIQALTVEHNRESLGIGEAEPRLSWSFVGDEKNWSQSSYEIEVSRPHLDSGKPRVFQVKSSDSALVPWPSKPLVSRESAKVRVRATGNDSKSTAWSEETVIETGLLQSKDWTATLIGAERIKAPSNALRPALFRKDFETEGEISSARLYITSQGVYIPWINGVRVGDHEMAPGWTSYRHQLNYQTFDVKDHLKAGSNVIGVEVGEGWFSTRLGWNGGSRNIYGDRLALLAQLEIKFENGKTATVTSDKSWRSSVGPRIASEIYDGEIYDVTREIKGWSTSSFNDKKWLAVEQMSFPSAKLQAPIGPPVRRTQTVKPQKLFKSSSGHTVIDFGQNLVGRLSVRISGPKGHTIVFTHTEVLENGEVATRPLRDCKAVDHLVLSGESVSWEPAFTFHGFRYVQVENWPSGEPK
jgi:alpha-L-rhamnosidase